MGALTAVFAKYVQLFNNRDIRRESLIFRWIVLHSDSATNYIFSWLQFKKVPFFLEFRDYNIFGSHRHNNRIYFHSPVHVISQLLYFQNTDFIRGIASKQRTMRNRYSCSNVINKSKRIKQYSHKNIQYWTPYYLEKGL
jgi:hypothetical protein